MAVNSTANLYIGPADVYVAPESQAPPADDAAFAAPWVKLGWLKEGLEITMDKTVYDLMPDQFVTPLLVQVTGVDVMGKASVDEVILSNMPTVWGLGSTVTQAAATGVIGKDTFKMAAGVATLPVKAIAFEGVDHRGFYLRVNFWRAVSVVSISLAMKKGAEMAIPIGFRALVDPAQSGQELGLIVRKTAAALP